MAGPDSDDFFVVEDFYAECVAGCDAEFAGCDLFVGFDAQFAFGCEATARLPLMRKQMSAVSVTRLG